MTLGARIRQAREAQGVRIVTLAEALGVHRRTLERWESGEIQPSRAKVKLLARGMVLRRGGTSMTAEEHRRDAERCLAQADNILNADNWRGDREGPASLALQAGPVHATLALVATLQEGKLRVPVYDSNAA